MTKLQSQHEDAYGESFHYFASSFAEWMADPDLDKIINHFKKQGFPFTVIRVKLPPEAGYEIKNYKPVVDDDSIDLVGIWE